MITVGARFYLTPLINKWIRSVIGTKQRREFLKVGSISAFGKPTNNLMKE